MTYAVNEIFYSVQGEGRRAGTANVFVRFAGCNLTCSRDNEAGFDCDTEFVSSTRMTAAEILERIDALWPDGAKIGPAIILTGGEPMLHVDTELIVALRTLAPSVIAMETNGTIAWPNDFDVGDVWISCSPKTAEHTLRIGRVNELRYVRHSGQGVPKPTLAHDFLFVSPAWDVNPVTFAANVRHCIALVKANPHIAFSMQQHKLWSVR